MYKQIYGVTYGTVQKRYFIGVTVCIKTFLTWIAGQSCWPVGPQLCKINCEMAAVGIPLKRMSVAQMNQGYGTETTRQSECQFIFTKLSLLI